MPSEIETMRDAEILRGIAEKHGSLPKYDRCELLRIADSLAARPRAGAVTISRDDAWLCHDAAWHRAQEVQDRRKRAEYRGLVDRLWALVGKCATPAPGGPAEAGDGDV